MPPRQTISFSGGPVPPFLARLQAQVNGGNSNTSSSSQGGNDNNDDGPDKRTFDPLLEARRKAKREEIEERRRKRAEAGPGARREGDEDEDDEFDGAQVVVLDEGKDLSREQALRGQQQAGPVVEAAATSRDTRTDPRSESIATPGTKRKADDQAGGPRTDGLDVLADEVAKRKRAEHKEKERKEKNKRAAKEKKKAGKGLSFDM